MDGRVIAEAGSNWRMGTPERDIAITPDEAMEGRRATRDIPIGQGMRPGDWDER